MRYSVIIIILVLFVGGCYGLVKKHSSTDKIVAHVGQAIITQREFEEAFKHSAHEMPDDLVVRHKFLENMINKKLILLDAEYNGLDKKQEFLDMIQNFWEQSLLTMALREKSKEYPTTEKLNQWIESLRQKNKVKIYQENI